MYLIYNCGYYATLNLQSKYIYNNQHTYKWYKFKKRFVTKVDDRDGKSFLAMTFRDVAWCPRNSKTIPPFMELKDWCSGKEGRFDSKPFETYTPDKYKKLFLLTEKDK